MSFFKVALFEDDALLSDSIVDFLTQNSFDVCAKANNLSSAVEVAGLVEYDVAIVDINLKGEPAYPVMDVVRARGVPFVIATAYSEKDIAVEYATEVFLRKPYSMGELRMAIKRAGLAAPKGLLSGRGDSSRATTRV